MSEQIQFNISDGLDAKEVDRINDGFYSRFNYPWVPMSLASFSDPGLWPDILNHDLGLWDRPRFKPDMKIWVGGCGTNQAILTALKFPQAQVIGSDVSTRSLETCGQVAADIGLTNLTLRQESLNETDYDQDFDLVICTGVIHHNADPSVPLNNLSRALKPDGVMELMVYNYYHRIQTTAFQKAIRLLGGLHDRPHIETELPLTMQMIGNFPSNCQMRDFLEAQKNLPEAAVADSLLQPVEYSYTIHSLDQLAQASQLRLTSYCLNQFDRLSGQMDWLMAFADADQRAAYETLDETDQWQISNLLLGEKSPMLWFYLQRQDNPNPMPGDRAINEKFLETTFTPRHGHQQNWILKEAGQYELSPASIPCPAPVRPIDPTAAMIFDACDGEQSIGTILQQCGIEAEPRQVNRMRLALCSNINPYLKAIR